MITDRCPKCGVNGRKVKAITLRSLLSETARERANGTDGYRFCKSGSCDVVYFHETGGVRFVVRDLRVPVFQKSADVSRTVCYCFEHTVAGIAEEVGQTGTSKVPEAIAEKCRQGLDRCEELNPQGACCLGNVKQVLQAALGQAGLMPSRHPEGASGCCSTPVNRAPSPPSSGKNGAGA